MDLLPIAYAANHKFCICALLKMLFIRYDMSVDSCLFSSKNVKYLNYTQFMKYFKMFSARAGVEGDLGSHSCRRGGTTQMYTNGSSTVDIQQRGRWASQCFLDYIDPPMQEAINKEQLFASTLF